MLLHEGQQLHHADNQRTRQSERRRPNSDPRPLWNLHLLDLLAAFEEQVQGCGHHRGTGRCRQPAGSGLLDGWQAGDGLILHHRK